MTLEEFAATSPLKKDPHPPRPNTGKTARDRVLDRANAEDIKAAITQQVDAGGPPEYILVNAVIAIGLLTNDMEDWANPLLKSLEETYGDMVQESLWVKSATEKALNLEARQSKYRETLKKRVTNLLNEYQRVEMDMRSILRTVEQMEEHDEETE